ncbi:MAG: hypothetical protein HY796_07560 [Elusimicrobia bacterium]|nr:hypothetical protein [Elusimicrobiota bacterium]
MADTRIGNALLFALVCLINAPPRLDARPAQLSGDAVFTFSMPDGFSHAFGEKPGSAVYIKNPSGETVAVFKFSDSTPEYTPELFRAAGEKTLPAGDLQWEQAAPAEMTFSNGIKCRYNVAGGKNEKTGILFFGIFTLAGKWYSIEINSARHPELARLMLESVNSRGREKNRPSSIPAPEQTLIIGLLGLLGLAAVILIF